MKCSVINYPTEATVFGVVRKSRYVIYERPLSDTVAKFVEYKAHPLIFAQKIFEG